MAQQSPTAIVPGQRSVIHILDQKVFNLNPDYFSYTVSKLALERSVALQAQSLAPALRVCGVAPGLMFLSGPQTQENFDRASRVNLMRHPIDAAQVAATCLFLAQNPCITGTTVCVDNGQHLVPLARDVMFMSEPGETS
jgi:NAD(P)-dependent dehydrogenase (short-subunit alcohol dehydrogenase family)